MVSSFFKWWIKHRISYVYKPVQTLESVSLTLVGVFGWGKLVVFDCGSPHLLSVSQATKHCHCLPASCQGACTKFVTLCCVHSCAGMWQCECVFLCLCVLLDLFAGVNASMLFCIGSSVCVCTGLYSQPDHLLSSFQCCLHLLPLFSLVLTLKRTREIYEFILAVI